MLNAAVLFAVLAVGGAEVDSTTGQLSFGGATVGPIRARFGTAWLPLGEVVDSSGSELTQRLGPDRTITARLSTPAGGILRYEVTDWGGTAPDAVELTLPVAPDERFYGLGEKFDRVEQSGKVARIMAVDAPGAKGDRSYKVVPWFLSTRGYGFHLDSAYESRFDLHAPVKVTLDHGALAFHLVAGPTMKDALSRFTGLVGRPHLPPAWVFAPWMSSDHWRDGGEVRYVIERYRELGLPGSVLVFDSPWEVSYNDFAWNMTQFGRGGSYEGRWYEGFASSDEMMGFLRERGFKVVLWLTPFLNESSYDEGVPGQKTGRSSLYDEAAAAGYLVKTATGAPLVVTWWKGNGSPVDFTNPAARAWFQARLAAVVAASGGVVGGFKADDGESDFIPLTARYHDGRTGAEMKNGYSVAYHGAVAGVLGAEGVLFSRSGFTGTQAFAAQWAGDNEPNFGHENGLPSVIVAGLSAAMSGWSIWGHDIGGYQENNPSSTPANLFMRWTQFGALSPIMQMHRKVDRGQHYPWSYGDEALANYRRWGQLHTRLFPYIYSFAAEASRTGIPILRPPVLEHPGDAATHGLNHTYYFGAWLLAAPVITNVATTRSLYLPDGEWYDFFTQERVAGGRVVEWTSGDQTRMPLYARRGGIIPMLRDTPLTLVDTDTSALELLVYPADDSRFELYDGTVIRAQPTSVDVAGGPTRDVRFRVLADRPLHVLADGAEIPWQHDGKFVIADAVAPTRLELLYTALPPTPPEQGAMDASGPAASPPDGGCGCGVGSAGGGGGAPAAGLLLLLAGWLRRRQAR